MRRRAEQRHISLKQVIVTKLKEATSVRRKKIDLSDLVGKWAPDSEFNEIIASQRQIDWDKWK